MQDEKLSCDTSGMRTRPHLGTGCHFPVVSGQPLIKVRAALDHHLVCLLSKHILGLKAKEGWLGFREPLSSPTIQLGPSLHKKWPAGWTAFLRPPPRVRLPGLPSHPQCTGADTLCTEEIQDPQGFCLTPPPPPPYMP